LLAGALHRQHLAILKKDQVEPEPAVFMLPIAVQAPVEGLYSSALAKVPLAIVPPATSTSPLGNSTA
jgi:hypothetical protein